jgi:transposase
MLRMQTVHVIRHKALVEGLSVRQVARQLGLSRTTVYKYLEITEPSRVAHSPRPRPVLDATASRIDALLAEWHARTTAKQRLTAARVHRQLLTEGYAISDRSVRQYLSSATQTGQTAEEGQEIGYLWVLKLLQGRVRKTELEKRFAHKLPFQDIATLHAVIVNRPLKYRNRAMTILLYAENLSPCAISGFLFLHQHTVNTYIDLYKTHGLHILFSPRRKEVVKSQDPQYKDALFKILHAPPSCYDINRTTWKMQDLQRIMAEEGYGLCKNNIRKIIKDAGYTMRKAKKVLTSNDPNYQSKLERITYILSHLGSQEKFFSIDEFGPFAVKLQGGKSLVAPGKIKTVPQYQKSKGSLICTAALELSTNQVTHFYSEKKNTQEMVKLLEILVKEYAQEDRIYFSWDAASWHASKALEKKVEEINCYASEKDQHIPIVELAPLPSRAQFLNVIESVFSGMARAIIHNSDYQSVEECKQAIDRYFAERNHYFKENPKRAGDKIWGKERVPTTFSESNNCKDPTFR